MHCLQDSEGAKFSPDLKLPKEVTIISKATDPKLEAYSSFDGTPLEQDLKEAGVTRVFVGGLATDYCVRTTVLDGLKVGFRMFLLLDSIRGINVKPDDSDNAVREMREAGANVVTLEDFAEPTEIPNGEPGGEASADGPLVKAAVKKKARLRSRGPYRKTKTEK